MTAITIQGLTKRFGTTTAVDALDLTIESGQLFFLLGPSGCGKTTLLRMIAGFIEPTMGTIRFGNRDVTTLPPNQRNAGMVFQSYALWPHMSVEENVGYGLSVRKVAGPKRRELTLAALKSVHMEDYAARKPNELSGGQQQRVALARALVIQPTVLLLDEPLSNLDAKLRLEMRSEIRRICSETKITTVYVTHDQKEALSMADCMAVLRSGRIMQMGSPRSLYDRPRSRFVADFLGETNFLPGVVRSNEAGLITLDTPAGVLRSSDGGSWSSGTKVTLSIRPEAIGIANSPTAASNTFRARRIRTIYLGEMAQHHFELTDHTLIRVFELNPSDDNGTDTLESIHVNSDDIVIIGE